MRLFTRVLFLVTGAMLFVPAPPLHACGDKLLSIARSIRLQHSFRTRHPASILVYAGRALGEKNAGNKDPLMQMSLLYMSLRVAGHRTRAADDVAELDEALRIGHFDFVVADLADMAVVSERVAALNQSVTVLPAVYKLNKVDFAAAQKQFRFVLKVPATSRQHLEAIDGAMRERTLAARGS
jgi:hypothetical protein